MTEPRTLLQMAGADPMPSALSQSVLVIIDAQGEYTSGALPLDGVGPALERLGELLARARDAGGPIIHVAHAGRPGGLFDRSAENGRILEAAAPHSGEPVIEKSLPNAFAGTELAAAIAGTGTGSLILAGFMTHLCISSTARAALDLGFVTTVAGDACASRDLPDPLGGVIPARQVHRAALAGLADRFACVVRAAEIPA